MWRLTTLACAVVLASACSSSTSTPEGAQAWALGDGTVTRQEYHRAVDLFATCVSRADITATARVLSPVDGRTLLFDLVPGEGSDDPSAWNHAVETCNETHLSLIEPAYVEKQPHVMDPSLRTAVRTCLKEHGLPTTGVERNATDFVADSRERASDILTCIDVSARRVFPNLPADLKILY